MVPRATLRSWMLYWSAAYVINEATEILQTHSKQSHKLVDDEGCIQTPINIYVGLVFTSGYCTMTIISTYEWFNDLFGHALTNGSCQNSSNVVRDSCLSTELAVSFGCAAIVKELKATVPWRSWLWTVCFGKKLVFHANPFCWTFTQSAQTIIFYSIDTVIYFWSTGAIRELGASDHLVTVTNKHNWIYGVVCTKFVKKYEQKPTLKKNELGKFQLYVLIDIFHFLTCIIVHGS